MDFITPQAVYSRICGIDVKKKAQKYPLTDPRCETDVTKVKVFTLDEWNKLNARMHTEELREEKRLNAMKAKEEIKEKSKEMYKDWTNTYLGARAKKLADREKRLAREEADRVVVDIKEAEYQAEERRKKLCAARTLQFYESERLKKFHGALTLSDVLRERDLQLRLRKMQDERDKNKGKGEFEELMRKIEEGTSIKTNKFFPDNKKEQDLREKRRLQAIENEKFVKTQIQDHIDVEESLKKEDIEEGKRIRRLVLEAEEEQTRLGRVHLENSKKLNEVLLEAISNHKKMKEVDRIKQEEFDEQIRIFAAAKKKMTLLRMEKEKQLFADKQVMQKLAIKSLQDQQSLLKNNETELIQKAIKERQDREDALLHAEAEKRKAGVQTILAYMHETIDRKQKQREQSEKEAKEDLKKRISEGESLKREEADLKAKRLAKGREIADAQQKQAEEHTANLRAERQSFIDWAREGDNDAEMEENLFQEYAKRIIDASERLGRNTFAMRKETTQNVGLGIGINLPGRGRVVNNTANLDPKCIVLPDLTNMTEHVEI